MTLDEKRCAVLARHGAWLRTRQHAPRLDSIEVHAAAITRHREAQAVAARACVGYARKLARGEFIR